MKALFLATIFSDSPPEPAIEGEGVDCSPPFWHGKLGDNWPLAGISPKAKPTFVLIVRDTINGSTTYKPKQWHRGKPGYNNRRRPYILFRDVLLPLYLTS